MENSIRKKRERPPRSSEEDFSFTVGINLLHDVIRNLNTEQIVTIKSIGLGSILSLSCSCLPYDVFNWLTFYMDTTNGTIDLPNGFSFTITKECVHIILDLPLGRKAISFSTTPEIVQRVNLEIHGKELTPTVYELAALIKNGLSGPPFAKAFYLLAMCTLYCPTNQCLPSSSYYNVIADDWSIKDFDLCSYVLQWLLLCINKHQLSFQTGVCAGCGLIPVITYFEFLVVSEVHIGLSIPRLPLWTDELLKLYTFLDSKDGSTFGKLQMKHLCSTPFAYHNQKHSVTYDLPQDVVSFIDSSYNLEDQIQVKKKLRRLSENLHHTILTNATRAISNCVDEVLRAFCNDDSSGSKKPSMNEKLFYNKSSLNCDDLLQSTYNCTPEDSSNQHDAHEHPIEPVKDASTSTREMIKEMIYYYMDSSFPPFAEVIIDDPPLTDVFSTKDIFHALVQNLSMNIEVPSSPLFDVDEFLSQELVYKVQVKTVDDVYEPMRLVDICQLDFNPRTKPKEEKIDCSTWFDGCQQDEPEVLIQDKGIEDDVFTFQEPSNDANQVNHRAYGLSLNEHLLGRSASKPSFSSDSEYPEWNFGEEFETKKSPSTPVFTTGTSNLDNNTSLKQKLNQQTGTTPSSSARLCLNKSTEYAASRSYNPLSCRAQKIDFNSQGYVHSPMSDSEDVGDKNNSFQWLKNRGTLDQRGMHDSINHISGEQQSVKHGQSSSEFHPSDRTFRPISLKHVQSDNTETPSRQNRIFDDQSDYRTAFPPSAPSFVNQNSFSYVPGSSHNNSHNTTRSNASRNHASGNSIICTQAEEELYMMLTTNIKGIVFSKRIFQIEERWTDERTIARCMANGGYINEYVMNAFVKMILFDQKMRDELGEKIGFIKHITYSEISEALMYESLDTKMYEKLFTRNCVGFRLEHAGLVHVPCTTNKQWFLITANFMDKCFDVLNPSHNLESLTSTIDSVVHNFKNLFMAAYPHCPNFKISDFKVRHVDVPKQVFKYDSGFFVIVFMETYNGLQLPFFSNEDLPAIKRKLLYKLVSNYYNRADQSNRIKEFIKKHVSKDW